MVLQMSHLLLLADYLQCVSLLKRIARVIHPLDRLIKFLILLPFLAFILAHS